MNDDSFRPPRRIEKSYEWAIQALIDRTYEEMAASTEPITDPLEFLNRLELIVNSKAFARYAGEIAARMVTALAVDNARSWRQAAAQGTRGREIYDALRGQLAGKMGDFVRAQVDRNAFYITSTPLDVSRQLTTEIMEAYTAGRRAEDIMRDLWAYAPDLTRTRMRLIARTEVSKTSTAITRAQSFDLGLKWYVWRTADDGRVRSSHRHLDDVLVAWTDPPSPEALIGVKTNLGRYNAGEAPNCRCYAEPVVDMKYLEWPHKVYTGGHILKMNRYAFERMVA